MRTFLSDKVWAMQKRRTENKGGQTGARLKCWERILILMSFIITIIN